MGPRGADERAASAPPLLRLSPEAGELLVHYPWPGNVRELRRTIEAATVLCRGPEIRPEHLPDHIRRDFCPASSLFTLHLAGRTQIPLQETVQQLEDALIDWALQQAGGQQIKAAKLLEIPRTTLQSKLGRRDKA